MPRFLVLILLIMAATFGCQEETIQPTWKEEPFKDTYTLTYTIEPIKIEGIKQEIGDVPVVGGVFQRLASIFANIAIDENNGMEVPIKRTAISMPQLKDVDFGLFQWIRLNKVILEGRPIENKRQARFDFVEDVKIYLHYKERRYPGESLEAIEPTEVELLRYNKNVNGLTCGGTCLALQINPDINWIEILQNTQQFEIEPIIKIDQVPQTMELTGTVEANVKLDLGF